MSGSIKSKKRYYNRKHKLESLGLRIRRWASSRGMKREVRLLIKVKKRG